MVIFVGMWGGFIGGGYAVVGMYVCILCFGKTFLESAALLKVAGLGISIVAATIFLFEGLIDWPLSCFIALFMTLGGVSGTRFGLERGNQCVRKVSIATSAILLVSLLLDN